MDAVDIKMVRFARGARVKDLSGEKLNVLEVVVRARLLVVANDTDATTAQMLGTVPDARVLHFSEVSEVKLAKPHGWTKVAGPFAKVCDEPLLH